MKAENIWLVMGGIIAVGLVTAMMISVFVGVSWYGYSLWHWAFGGGCV